MAEVNLPVACRTALQITYLSPVRLVDSSYQMQKARFSRTGSPHDHHKFPLVNLQTYIVNNLICYRALIVYLCQIFHF